MDSDRSKMGPRTGWRVALACGVVTALSSAPCRAQSSTDGPAATVDPQATPDIVVTGSRADGYLITQSATLGFGLSLQDTPASVSAISQDLIRDLRGKKLRDISAYIPGVSTDYKATIPGDSIISRGFAATQLQNGVRISNLFINRPLALLDRIEIVKGPAGPEVGIASPGGVANFITRKPQAAFAAEAEASVGDFGHYAASASLTGPLNAGGSLRALMIGSYQQVAEWRPGRPDRTPFWTVAPSVSFDYAPHSNVTLEFEHTEQRNPGDFGVIYLEGAGFKRNFAPRDFSTNSPDERKNLTFTRIEGTLQQYISAAVNLNVQASYIVQMQTGIFLGEPRAGFLPYKPGTLVYDPSQGSVIRPFPFPGFTDGSAFENKEHNPITSVQATLNVRRTIGPVVSRLDLGAGYNSQSDRNTNPVYGVSNAYDIFATDARQPISFTGVFDPGETDVTKERYYSVFGEYQATVSDRIHLIAGARHDWYRIRQGPVDNVTAYQDYGEEVTSFRLAASVDVTRHLAIYAGYADASIPQSGRRRDLRQIDPLKGVSAEAGAKLSLFGGRALLTGAAYRIVQQNIEACDTDASIAPDDVASCRFVVSQGRVRIAGIESELQGKVTNSLGVSAGLSVASSRTLSSDDPAAVGKRFANFPNYQLSAFANYDWRALGVDRLSTRLGLIRVGKREGDAENRFALPSYTRVDLGAGYDVTRTVTVEAFVENLFDTYYFVNSPPFGDGRLILPGNRRLIEATVRVKL